MHALLGEIQPGTGVIINRVHSTALGYAPQRPVVISGTVEENILFGRPYNKLRMQQVQRWDVRDTASADRQNNTLVLCLPSGWRVSHQCRRNSRMLMPLVCNGHTGVASIGL